MSTVVQTIGSNSDRTKDGNARTERKYAVIGVTTPDDADAAVLTELQSSLGITLALNGLQLDTINSVEANAENVFETTVVWKTFSRAEPLAEGETEFSFQISTNPVRVKIPIAVQVYAEANAVDFTPKLINDIGDGNDPEGVDIFEPVYTETKTLIVPTSDLTTSYRDTLKRTVGKVNSDPFNGWQAGEVLLTGVSGTRRGTDDSELSFQWQVRENETNLVVGGISVDQKKGWEYLWPRSELRGGDTNSIYKKITHICVAQIFKETSYAGLGV